MVGGGDCSAPVAGGNGGLGSVVLSIFSTSFAPPSPLSPISANLNASPLFPGVGIGIAIGIDATKREILL